MLSNKKANAIVTEMLIRERTINISLIFIAQSSFKVTTDLNITTNFYKLLYYENTKQNIASTNSNQSFTRPCL